VDRDTVEVYERRAAEWQDARRPDRDDDARAFGRRADRAGRHGPVVDLGCGPGWYAPALGSPVVALDAARAMLDLVPDHAPAALRVQADLSALPFARGALSGAWASKCYVHLPRSDVPLALADLHRSMGVGAPLELHAFSGELEHGPLFEDRFAGRRFSRWPVALLADVVRGAGFEIARIATHGARDGVDLLMVQATRARTLADTVAPGMRLLVCGLNPSVYAADAGVAFARPGNRFWRAALAAGLVTRDRDPHHALAAHGIGLTDLVKRATPRADELTADDYRTGLDRLERLVDWLAPQAVCFVGLAGWRASVDRHAVAGPQPLDLGGRPVYVMPSTSGVNAHASVEVLTEHLRAAGALASHAPLRASPRSC
jgi:double-stranded uracil-DNA glycosylase